MFLHYLEGLDSWLLPFHLPDHNSFEKFIYMHKELFNDYYYEAVKHLQFALDSTSSASAALLPLIQVWTMKHYSHILQVFLSSNFMTEISAFKNVFRYQQSLHMLVCVFMLPAVADGRTSWRGSK